MRPPPRSEPAALPEVPLHEPVRRLSGPRRGRLGSRIWRVALGRGGVGYLKVATPGCHDDLAAEHDRLRWLFGRLPVPEVVEYAASNGLACLLIRELPGQPAHRAAAQLDRDALVDRLAAGLRQIHALPVNDAFDCSVERELASAERLLRTGCVDLAAVQRAAGEPARALLDRLAASAAPTTARVFTHGDYCLPNVMIEGERPLGFLDWAAAGAGDPHRDLALAIDSVRDNLGAARAARFIDGYGRRRIDPERLAFHRRLDLFFTHLYTEPRSPP